MIFSHQTLTKTLSWSDTSHICELIIESPRFLREFLAALARREDEEKFSFIRDGKKLSLKDDVDIIFNPLKLEFNNKKALTVLLKMLVKTSLSEDFYESTNRFKTNIIKYLGKLTDVEDYSFEVDSEDFNLDVIAKAINLHIIGDEDDFVELLTDYMSMMTELLDTKLFIFINLRTFLEDNELKRLIHNIDNHEFDILLVESQPENVDYRFEKIIIDHDLCEL